MFNLLDFELIFVSVEKTGKVFVVYEVICFCGVGVEVVSLVFEWVFELFDVLVCCLMVLDVLILFSLLFE